jgi:hypothetical protein
MEPPKKDGPRKNSKRNSKRESILYRKNSFGNARKESGTGISPEYDMVNKKLVSKDKLPEELAGLTAKKESIKPVENGELEVLHNPRLSAKSEKIDSRKSGNPENIPDPQSELKGEARGSLGQSLAQEIGIDVNLLDKKNALPSKNRKYLNKCEVEGLKEIHKKDPRRSIEFLEEVRASRKMKALSKKYGSKGKSAKEYFMESYDADTMLEVMDDAEEASKGPAHIFNFKGEEIKKGSRSRREEPLPPPKLEQIGVEQEDDILSLLGSPIAIRSLTALLTEGIQNIPLGLKQQAFDQESYHDFWGSLERLQVEEEGSFTESLRSCESLRSDSSSLSYLRGSNGDVNELDIEDAEEWENKPDVGFSYDPAALDRYLVRIDRLICRSNNMCLI